MATFEDVPDEIIEHVLRYLTAEENLASIQLLCRRFNHVANEAHLWRYYCRSTFRYWHPEHAIEDKFVAQVSSLDWKKLWLTRRRRNARASALLEEVLRSKVGQLNKLRQICQLGYDAKDFLIDQLHVDESDDDVLARR
jgi:F-box protein 21